MAETKGVWVSLAYTRAFGTLGPKFKSWYAHHSLRHGHAVDPKHVITELRFDERLWYGFNGR